MSNQRGFTLVELMVVVAIIALIASIVIPNYVHARAQAAVADSEANLKQIATALELYYADLQCYPGGTCAGAAGGAGGGGGTTVTPALFGGANNPYLNVIPTDDVGHQPYGYAIAGAGAAQSYELSDPASYDASLLQGLQQLGGTACATTCTYIHYSPQAGLYGSNSAT
ncbi:MAG: type II secretion system protein [Vulcanimicrobiaceae bacterium]